MMRVLAFRRSGRDGRRVFGHRPLLATLVATVLGISACDSPYCVFTATGCTDSDDSNGGDPDGESAIVASFPTDGTWILPGAPVVNSFAPEGVGAHPESVVALQFSESLSSTTLTGAFELRDDMTGFPEALVDPPPLLGDGRIAILIPVDPLAPGTTYSIRLTDVQAVTDLTGVPIVAPVGDRYGTFTVGDPPPSAPQLLLTWPPAGGVNQSDLTQIVALFDRPMDSTTFDLSSWQVKVDDVTPAVNPFPAALSVDGMAPVTQVWTWSSRQGQGPVRSLGVDVDVSLELSNAIQDESGATFGAETILFALAPIRVPTAATKHPGSAPADAIGGPNLLDTAPVLVVELHEPAEVDDTLSLYITGRASNTSPFATTLTRSIELDAGDMTIDVFPDDLDLLSSPSPIEGRLGDGPASIAISHVRGSVRTAVRLVDAEPLDVTESEPLLFDVTPPVLEGLGTSGSDVTSFASDLSDLVIVGRADEEIRRVEVTTPMGDNWVDPEIPTVVSASSDGLFVAKPVSVGILDSLNGTLPYEVLIYDRALNPADSPAMGQFDQLGAVGPGAPLPGPTVKVDVFDATTLELLPGALVMTHQEDGGTVTPVHSEFTDPAGHAEPDSAAVGLTLVTVQLDGYDTFTIEGLRREVLQVPLRPQGLSSAFTEGSVTSPSPGVDISNETNVIGDTRRTDTGPVVFDVGFCALDGSMSEFLCPFGPQAIVPAEIGGQSVLSADFGLTSAQFSPDRFLNAFELRLPAPPADPGATDEFTIEVSSLLINGSIEDEAQPIASPQLSSVDAVNLGPLAQDPSITVEAVSPGSYGDLVIGLGLPLDPVGDEWTVLGAYAGAADGLASRGTIESDFLLRAELVDTSANRVGKRPRFSLLSGTLTPPDVPELLLPTPGGSSGGTSYVLGVRNVITDADAQPGLYRVTLTDSTGRSWVLWREDPPDGGGNVRVVVPDLTSFPGGMQLQNGTISCQVSAFAWPDLQLSTFMWTDIERQHDLYGHAAVVTFSQP